MRTPFLVALVVTMSCASAESNTALRDRTSSPESQPQEVRIDERFGEMLAGDPVLASGAVRPVRVISNELFLVSVGVVANPAPGRESPQQALDMQRVALAKARAQLVEYCKVDVDSRTDLRTLTTIRTVSGNERIETNETLDTTILLRAHGLVRDAAIIGTWYTPHRETFQLAIAVPLQEDSP